MNKKEIYELFVKKKVIHTSKRGVKCCIDNCIIEKDCEYFKFYIAFGGTYNACKTHMKEINELIK